MLRPHNIFSIDTKKLEAALVEFKTRYLESEVFILMSSDTLKLLFDTSDFLWKPTSPKLSHHTHIVEFMGHKVAAADWLSIGEFQLVRSY